jgi:hypothetical protein
VARETCPYGVRGQNLEVDARPSTSRVAGAVDIGTARHVHFFKQSLVWRCVFAATHAAALGQGVWELTETSSSHLQSPALPGASQHRPACTRFLVPLRSPWSGRRGVCDIAQRLASAWPEERPATGGGPRFTAGFERLAAASCMDWWCQWTPRVVVLPGAVAYGRRPERALGLFNHRSRTGSCPGA